MNIEYSPICCPQCKRRVAYKTNIQKTNVVARCRTCEKLVVYELSSNSIKIKDIPHRGSSSGVGLS